jgi:putative ABC transport system permease protein
MWLRVDDPETGKQVAAAIEREFGKTDPSLKVETESAGVARFAGRSQSLLAIIQAVVTILVVDMIIILSNSISITTRERRVEMAVLKVLGFQPGHIVLLVIGEAMLVGGLSGLLGAGLTFAVSELNAQRALPVDINFLTQFPMPAAIVPWGLALGAFVGLVGSVLPALNARKVKVSDVFANLA